MTEENNLNFPRQTLAFIDPKTRDRVRTGIGGQGSGESQVRGLIDRRKIRGGPPHGYRLLESPLRVVPQKQGESVATEA